MAWAVSAITGIVWVAGLAFRRRLGLGHGHTLLAVERHHHLVTLLLQAPRQHVPVHLVVFDQKDFRHPSTQSC
jgi:hypothetical protein